MALIPIQDALKQIVKAGSILPSVQPKPELSETENNFLIALNGKKVKDCTTEEIIGAIAIGLLKLGLKPQNTEATILQLAATELITAHGTLTFLELQLAFSMATRMQLDFDPQTYQNFSILYLNQLIAAYKKWSAQTYSFIRPENVEPLDDYIYQNVNDNYHRGAIEQGLQDIRDGVLVNVSYIPYDWYRVLVADGYIADKYKLPENKRVSELTSEEKIVLKSAQQYMFDFFVFWSDEHLYTKSEE